MINIDIQDNHEEATIGAFMICDLVTLVSSHNRKRAKLKKKILKISSVLIFIAYINYTYINLQKKFFKLGDSEDLDNDVDELLQEFEARCGRPILHTVCFY